jgi:Family of unknown function (DUF5681)
VTWVKGQSGNARGRPPVRHALAPVLRRLLRTTEPTAGLTYGHLIVQALVQAAIAGNVEAIKTILERTDGKMPTPVEHSGRDGGPVPLELVRFDYVAAIAELEAPGAAPGSDGHRPPRGAPEVPGDGPALG